MLDMFGYMNKVYLDIEIEFIKGKFVFSVVWWLDFAEIINVRDQFFFFFESEDIFCRKWKSEEFFMLLTIKYKGGLCAKLDWPKIFMW